MASWWLERERMHLCSSVWKAVVHSDNTLVVEKKWCWFINEILKMSGKRPHSKNKALPSLLWSQSISTHLCHSSTKAWKLTLWIDKEEMWALPGGLDPRKTAHTLQWLSSSRGLELTPYFLFLLISTPYSSSKIPLLRTFPPFILQLVSELTNTTATASWSYGPFLDAYWSVCYPWLDFEEWIRSWEWSIKQK